MSEPRRDEQADETAASNADHSQTVGASRNAEPDYRMSLAAERTYLAYLRTGLALMAAGVGVAGALPDAGAKMIRRVIGLAFVAIGAAVFLAARRRWVAVDRAMRAGQPLPNAGTVRVVGWALGVMALATMALIWVV